MFELAVVAGLSVNASGSASVVLIAGRFVAFLLGVFGLLVFGYYFVTLGQ